jgi:hypothetical protein
MKHERDHFKLYLSNGGSIRIQFCASIKERLESLSPLTNSMHGTSLNLRLERLEKGFSHPAPLLQLLIFHPSPNGSHPDCFEMPRKMT